MVNISIRLETRKQRSRKEAMERIEEAREAAEGEADKSRTKGSLGPPEAKRDGLSSKMEKWKERKGRVSLLCVCMLGTAKAPPPPPPPLLLLLQGKARQKQSKMKEGRAYGKKSCLSHHGQSDSYIKDRSPKKKKNESALHAMRKGSPHTASIFGEISCFLSLLRSI